MKKIKKTDEKICEKFAKFIYIYISLSDFLNLKEMKKGLFLLSFLMFFGAKSQNHSVSLGGNLIFSQERLSGLSFEYGLKISPKFTLTAGAEFSRYNNFPAFANRGIIGGHQPQNQEVHHFIVNNVKSSQTLWKRYHQQNYSLGVNFFPFKNEKHRPYLRAGLGLSVQDAFELNIESVENQTIAENYKIGISQRGATILAVLPAVGYDFHWNEKWAVGAEIGGQLPVTRSKNYFKYGGAGFDEFLKAGIKITRKF